MWLLLEGPTGHLRSPGQRVNNFKSHSPADFSSGLPKPRGLHTSSHNFQSTLPPPPPPSFDDYYFLTLSGRGGVFRAKGCYFEGGWGDEEWLTENCVKMYANPLA